MSAHPRLFSESAGSADWPRRLVLWASIAAVIFLCFWYVFDVILLAFAGALLAIILHFCAEWVQMHTPMPMGPRLSYTATVLGIVGICCLIGYFIIPHAISEALQITRTIPGSIAQITDYLDKTDWGRYVVHAAHSMTGGSNIGPQVRTVTSDFATAVEGAVVILVVGLYGALYAREYSVALVALAPEPKHRRFREVSGQVVYVLGWWMIGQLIPMAVLGAATMIALWALGVPLAFALGLLTGLMIFIPYIGSWIAFVPTVLVALTKGPHTAMYVIVLYLAIHAFEGYVLTPLVQKRVVLLPPVLTILAQLFMWKVSGLLGVALATPIAAAVLALVRILYLREEIKHQTGTA